MRDSLAALEGKFDLQKEQWVSELAQVSEFKGEMDALRAQQQEHAEWLEARQKQQLLQLKQEMEGEYAKKGMRQNRSIKESSQKVASLEKSLSTTMEEFNVERQLLKVRCRSAPQPANPQQATPPTACRAGSRARHGHAASAKNRGNSEFFRDPSA